MMLEIILTSSVLILIIMLLRAFCRKSIKPTLRYALWLVVVVRLVLPFSLFSSNASVMNFFGRAEMVDSPVPSADITPSAPIDTLNDTPAVDAPDDAYIPKNQSAPEVLPPLGEGYIDTITPASPANQTDPIISAAPSTPISPTDSDFAPTVQDYPYQQYTSEPSEAPVSPIEPIKGESVPPSDSYDILSSESKQPSVSISLFGRSFEIQPWLMNSVKAVWLVVAAAMGLWFFGVNIAFSLSLCRNRRELDVNAPLKVYASPNLASPCLFGFFRPAIYVNEKAAQDESSLRFVLAHEYCHYRHGDMFWSLLRCTLLSVYWFNPLVWAAAYLSKKDCECSCDEAAIKLLGEPLRINYGKALVSMIPERRADPRLIGVASTSMSGSKRAIHERVKLIAKKPKNTVIAVVLIIAVLAAAVGCTFTSADNDKGKDLPEDDIGEDISEPDNQEDDTSTELDSTVRASGMTTETYDALKYYGKPYILPINTASGVVDCQVYVDVDGDRLLGVSTFAPVDYSLDVFASGYDHCYIYDSSNLQIYYYNVTTGETTPLLSDSYEGYTKDEFIKYFERFKSSDYYDSYREMWLSQYELSVSSDGKWLTYTSSKWVENGEISAKEHRWLYNLETGEELIADDLLNSAIGENASFNRILDDNKLLAETTTPDGTQVFITVDILTNEADEVLKVPQNVFYCSVSDKYILTFDGNADVYDITTGKTHSFEIGVENYDWDSLYLSQCKADCLAITPKHDVAYVIDLVHDKIDEFTPPDARYGIRIAEVYEDSVHFDVYNISSMQGYGSFVVQTEIEPEPIDSETELKLYSRHVEYSKPEYQKFIPEVYDLTPIYEILGEEAADRATAEYYKLNMNERQSIPPLYRLLRDTGITREQLEAYNQTAENKLSDEVIEALYSLYDTMVCEKLIGNLGMFYDGKAYNFHEAVYYLIYNLPGNSGAAFLNDVAEYMTNTDNIIRFSDIEAAHKVIEEYLNALNAGEPLEDYPATSTDYLKYFIKNESWAERHGSINVEVCDQSTEYGVSKWEEIRKANAYSTYYLPITIGSKTVDCEIKTVTAGTGKIANISYRTLSGGLRIFGEDTRGCYVFDELGRSIYRFDLATAECTPVLSIAESGYLIESPVHYEHIPRDSDKAGYPLQVSLDGKWLLYRSDKWLKENTQPIEKYHTWLHNIETGEDVLFDDAVIYVAGYEKHFEYLLADNKILVSAEESDGSTGYSIVDIPTKKSEKILTVPAHIYNLVVSENYILYYEAPKDENKKAVIAIYDISDGSVHRFRFNKPLGNIYSWDCLGKCIAMRIDGSSDGAMVMNLEDDSAVNLIVPDNIEYGSMLFELVSDRLVLIEELATGYNINIAVQTGLDRQARDTSLAGRLYGRHVEYTAKEYQKFIPEVYDLTPIYEILGEEKAAAAIADYYSLICEERQALPPLYRLLHGMGITKEQLIKYNQTAKNKLSDDVIEALYLDWTLVSSEAERVKKALLAETSLFYDGYAYSLNEAISANLPYDVKAVYLGRIEGYVRENCSDHWINLVDQVKESCEEAVTAASSKVGETIYSFDKTAVQGDKTADYRIDIVFTGRDRHQSSDDFSTTLWGEFELRAFDKNGKQTGSVKLYNGLPGNQFGAMGLDTKDLSHVFKAIVADNIILFSTPYQYATDDVYNVTVYGITFSGELFMYEIEDSEDFTYISSDAGAEPINRISANAIIAGDLYSYIRPNLEGDLPDTRYLHDSYEDYDIRQICFYQIDEENRKIIPKIFINGYYRANIVDSVISEQKPNAADPLYVMTSYTEAYVYYIADRLHPSEKSGVYYRKTVKDDNGEWHAEGETMRVKTQADVAKWFEPFGGNAS